MDIVVCTVEHCAHIEDEDIKQHIPNPTSNHQNGTKCWAKIFIFTLNMQPIENYGGLWLLQLCSLPK